MKNKPWVDELLVPIGVCHKGIEIANRFDDAQTAWENWPADRIRDLIWTISKSPIPKKQKREIFVRFLIETAKSCLHIFEDQFPEDARPRKAIEATENWLTAEDKEAAWKAAKEARAAAWDAAARAERAARVAAWDAEWDASAVDAAAALGSWVQVKEILLQIVPRNPLLGE